MLILQRVIRLSLACSILTACSQAGLPGTGTGNSTGNNTGNSTNTSLSPNLSPTATAPGAANPSQAQPAASASGQSPPGAVPVLTEKPEFSYSGAFPAAIKGSAAAQNYAGLLRFEAVSAQRAAGSAPVVYKLAQQPWNNAAGQTLEGPANLPAKWQVSVYRLDDAGRRYGFPVASESHTGEFGEIRWNGVNTAGERLNEGRFVLSAVPEGFPVAELSDPLLLLSTPLPKDAPPPEYATEHLLARFLNPTLAASQYTLLGTDAGGWSKVLVPPSSAGNADSQREALLSLARTLYQDPNVQIAEPDLTYRVDLRPNDPRLGEQYALQKVKAEEAWDVGVGAAGTVIAIVDTGIDTAHPDLRARLLGGWNTISDNNNSRDDHGHGTHCAGIAAGISNNSEGIAGLGAGSSLLPVKVMGANGSGSSLDIAEGIRWAADHGAHIINLSLGMNMGSEVIRQALQYATGKGVLVLAAMGNDGGQIASYPAAYSTQVTGMMAVGSTDSGDQRSYFSNYGSWISVTAPGSQILSTLPQYSVEMNRSGQAYGPSSGTSMATPYVAGLAGLLKSQQPSRSPADIIAAIIQGVDDLGPTGFDNQFGHGRINAFRSMSLNLPVASPTPTPIPTATPISTPAPSALPTPTPAPAAGVGGLVLDID